MGATLPPTSWKDCGLSSVTAEYQCVSPLQPTVTQEHPLPKGSAHWQEAPFPLQQVRQLTKRSCFFVFPQPCVALQKQFLAIFVHKAGLRELREHKQFVSSVLRTFPNTWTSQPLQWRTSQTHPPTSIYSHNSKVLSPLPTFSSLKFSESRDHLKESAASATLPAPIGVRWGKQQLPLMHTHSDFLNENYQHIQDYPACCRKAVETPLPKCEPCVICCTRAAPRTLRL